MNRERLGEVRLPSGVLLVVDAGLLGRWRDHPPPIATGAFEHQGVTAVAIDGLPTDRPLELFAEPMGEEPFATLWRTVTLEVQPAAQTARTVEGGAVTVDCARLMFLDARALAAWKHDEPIDGRADIVFWGRDAEQAAARTGAPKLSDSEFGWVDLEVDSAVTHARAVEALRGSLKFATDFRPHSHHFQLLAQMRANPAGSGTLSLGESICCGFFSQWGDGVFPVRTELDSASALVRVVVELGTKDAVRNLRAVNGL